jgi:hypothetical protein
MTYLPVARLPPTKQLPLVLIRLICQFVPGFLGVLFISALKLPSNSAFNTITMRFKAVLGVAKATHNISNSSDQGNSNGFFASIAYRADLQAQGVDLSPFIRYDISRISSSPLARHFC